MKNIETKHETIEPARKERMIPSIATIKEKPIQISKNILKELKQENNDAEKIKSNGTC